MPRTPLVRIAALALAIGLTGPALAEDVPPPPDLSSSQKYLTNTEIVVVPGSIQSVRAFMNANPLTGYLQPTGRIPRIEGIEVLKGPWGQPGALRRVDQTGGASVHERVLTNTDTEFTYQIWNITAPSGRFIDHILGEIRFAEANGDTTITWDYNIRPAAFFARPSIRSFLREDFAPFMETGLAAFVADYETRGR